MVFSAMAAWWNWGVEGLAASGSANRIQCRADRGSLSPEGNCLMGKFCLLTKGAHPGGLEDVSSGRHPVERAGWKYLLAAEYKPYLVWCQLAVQTIVALAAVNRRSGGPQGC